ncbi:expressed unknown protein [Seminavis robusta]|uniref:Uncharacterized protein n=1 Tax=Seminavis robusta TaxID=568900 RepID=A0A9N8DG68_9STRA|nr:expressed unknown protein [Seminavis robusta]|eukprot:Sro126_g060520.1 n/a (310) ;mRNA; f:28155-29084
MILRSMSTAKALAAQTMPLEDLLSSNAGHSIWEFCSFHDRQKLFCTSRTLRACKEKVVATTDWKALEELEFLRAIQAVDKNSPLIKEMEPFIRSGNYYLVRHTWNRIADAVYPSVKEAMADAVDFSLTFYMNESFEEGWEGLLINEQMENGMKFFHNADEEEEDNYKKRKKRKRKQHTCVNGQFCAAAQSGNAIEKYYRVNLNHQKKQSAFRTFCGKCIDQNLFLAVRFAAFHGMDFNVNWGLAQLVDGDNDPLDEEDEEYSPDDVGRVVEEPIGTKKKALEICLWEWNNQECDQRKVLWFVGTSEGTD